MVKYLKIGNEKYPVRIGYYVLKQIKDQYEKDLFAVLKDVQNTMDFTPYEDILFYSLEMGAWATSSEMRFKRDEMQNILDLCFLEFVALVASAEFFPPVPETTEPPQGKQKGQKTPHPKSSTSTNSVE